MNIRVIDFDSVTKHYLTYQEGMKEIRKVRDGFQQRVEPIRKEMQSIISQATSGIVLDNSTQQDKAERFQKMQQELVSIDSDYKHQMKELHENLNLKTYDELEVIISEWATENSIDIVTSKMEIIFANSKYDSTSEVLELLKSKELYVEPIEEKLPEVQS